MAFRKEWHSRAHAAVVIRAVEFAETAAAHADVTDRWNAVTAHSVSADVASVAAAAAVSAAATAAGARAADAAARDAAYNDTNSAAHDAAITAAANDDSAVATAVAAAVDAAKALGDSALIRSDFDLLVRVAAERHWTDDTPVRPDFFPPLSSTDPILSTPSRLPTGEELSRLPLLARVAFAARCARRVQPLFRKHWPSARLEYLTAVDHAIQTGELLAATSHITTAFEYADAADAADNAAEAAGAYAGRSNADSADSAVISCASARSSSATAAAAAAVAGSRNAEVANAARTAAAAAAAAVRSEVAIRSDYDLLIRAATQHNWTDDTLVSPDFFPPLAANDDITLPAEDTDPGPPLSLLFEVGTLTPYEMQQVIGLVSEMYHGLTGDNLIIDSTDTFDPVASLVPQGGLS